MVLMLTNKRQKIPSSEKLTLTNKLVSVSFSDDGIFCRLLVSINKIGEC